MSTQTLQVISPGLECQVKKELKDNLSGAVSLLDPYTVNAPFIHKFSMLYCFLRTSCYNAMLSSIRSVLICL